MADDQKRITTDESQLGRLQEQYQYYWPRIVLVAMLRDFFSWGEVTKDETMFNIEFINLKREIATLKGNTEEAGRLAELNVDLKVKYLSPSSERRG